MMRYALYIPSYSPDSRLTATQDIYQRSISLEGTSGGGLEFGKKKLPWFQKDK